MYNDPNQAQPPPPYGLPPQQPTQPPQSYGQPATPFDQPQYAQAQYVQPPYSSVPPTAPPSSPAFPQSAQRPARRIPWLVLGVTGGVLLAIALAAVLALVVFAKPGPKEVVDAYYQAIQQQDYNKAFQYIDSTRLGGTKSTIAQTIFVRAQQAIDRLYGPVTGYNVTKVTNLDDRTAQVIVSFTRKNTSYPLQYTLSKIDGTWRIEQTQ